MMRLPDVKQLVSIFFSLTITAGCLFGSAGRLDWWNAWVLLGLSLVTGLAFTAGRNPELDAERRNIKAGKSWDKALAGITVLLGPMAMWITAGLDERFHWSKGMSYPGFTAGLAAAVLGAGTDRVGHAIQQVLFRRGSHSERSRAHGGRWRALPIHTAPRLYRHGGIYSGDTVDSRFILGARTSRG